LPLSAQIRNKYESVIGLEVHCQLQTESKIFASDPNLFGAQPNTNIGVITLAHPGVLPKLNKKAVEYAIKWGLACQCEINPWQIFDRKNYFYPDLPKGYQITQDKTPICLNGHYSIRYTNAQNKPAQKTITIHHIHLEEDAGKSIHADGQAFTSLDYNRAGTPLLEMVTEPCIDSAEQAAAFMYEMRRLVRYLAISDGNMDEGSLRCDVNISVRPIGSQTLGTKVEIKNMNSPRFIQKAIDYEIERQITAIETGQKIIQETRSFDPDSNTTTGMREKETQNDYRYFPEPDLPPFEVPASWVAQIKSQMPALPNNLFEKYTSSYKLSTYDATQLVETRETAAYFEELLKHTQNIKAAANWLMGPIKSYLNEQNTEIQNFVLPPQKIAEIIAMVDSSKISNTVATQKIFSKLIEQPNNTAESIAKTGNLLQESNTDTLLPLINDVLLAFPEKVKEYKNGKKGLLAMFMGEVMKRSKGTADPKQTTALLTEALK
jgi:aspartyl-tRNA(Asn)/glutamyl-tRNA(Gln) amidotransferase subunit B